MPRFRDKIAFIVATKDRPTELRRMLKSLEAQSYQPNQVIIVDGGDQQVNYVVQEYPNLYTKYLRCIPPSASRQRNIGVRVVDPGITLIGFLDDDIVFVDNALEAVMEFWEKASYDIGGAVFNMVNPPPLYASWLKFLPTAEKLGLYSRDRGMVLPSGFHTMIGYVPEMTYTQWLPTIAVAWRRGILEKFQFDEWFEGYSYLEDLDFSYRVGKKWKLAVVADARFYHHHSPEGRDSGFQFGKKEAINRIYFVRKHHELSTFFCLLALFGRIFISILLMFKEKRPIYYIQRIFGNVKGIIESF